MVSAIVRWIKDRLGISALERENVQLVRALLSQTNRLDDLVGQVFNLMKESQDYAARIAFLENSLTAKATTAKIVPKPHKTTFRQFAEAASKASEEE